MADRAFPDVVPHLAAADGQSPVEHRPGHGLFAARRRHGAHIAVIAVEIPRRRDEVAESEVWDHRAAACKSGGEMPTELWGTFETWCVPTALPLFCTRPKAAMMASK